ncbi:MAG: tetratricopeptide repeat protein, partial [Candidatus Thorarchaeota archaeon]
MTIRTKTIHPYEASDGEYLTLVEFSLNAAHLLHPDFIPTSSWSEKEQEGVQDEWSKTRFYFGNEVKNIEVLHKMHRGVKEPDRPEDEVFVRCNGLPAGLTFELEAQRRHREQRSVEIRVEGPEEKVDRILDEFELQFGKDETSDSPDLSKALKTARAAAKVHAWRAVEINALDALDKNPNHAEAQMYLGMSLAAQGYEPEGENLLLASLTLEPKNPDAYYNLGVLVMQQGRCMLATDSFRHGLRYHPESHALHFQLGRALERLGNLEEAQEAYQNAIGYSLQSSRTWGYVSRDFTEEAKDGLRRVQDAMR